MMFDESVYCKRIEDLFSRHQSVAKAGFSSESYKPGLDAMRRFDASLGSPSSRLRCIHVAGTNGKGSVCSMIASSLSAAGFRVGLYTSPHLVDFRERIKVLFPAGAAAHRSRSSEVKVVCETIPKEGVWDFLESYDKDMEGLTFFEVTTGMAFWWFAQVGVDVAVVETGLGGRLDSTNIIVPEVSVVTSIGLDHCALLGNTRAQIATEKAGIFKAGVPAVIGAWDGETGPVFEERAAALGCPLCFADRQGLDVHGYELDLKGPCQDMNLRTAITALTAMGAPVCKEGLQRAGEICVFRGRWEYLRPDIICDIGHNPPALKENFARLEAMGKPMVIVYGIMADKDLDGIASLMPSAAQYVLTAPATPRALLSSELYSRLSALRPDLQLSVCPTVPDALALAKSILPPGGLIYVGGSTYVVSEAVTCLK